MSIKSQNTNNDNNQKKFNLSTWIAALLLKISIYRRIWTNSLGTSDTILRIIVDAPFNVSKWFTASKLVLKNCS